MKHGPMDWDAQLDAVLRALCIVTHAHTSPQEADYALDVRFQRRLAWAKDIVRQVAERPLPAIENHDD